MALRARWRNWVDSALGAGLVATALAGCSSSSEPAVDVAVGDPNSPPAAVNNGAAPSGPGAAAAPAAAGSAKADRLHQSFSDACTVEINADSGVALPPTYTLTKKNTGQLNEAVQRIWNDIKFTGPDGKPQTYILSFEIAHGDKPAGTIEVLMQPDLAPNHVRNFVALTMLGFYDGLRVDRVVQQQGDGDAAASKLVLLEAGSPVEDADPTTSHLGYWLRPEFSEVVKHESGSVGACLLQSEDNAETAACRFYITLTPAPAMDGNFTIFGKVTRGIETARALTEAPVRDRDGGPDQGRPVTPIVIRKATVRPVPVVE